MISDLVVNPLFMSHNKSFIRFGLYVLLSFYSTKGFGAEVADPHRFEEAIEAFEAADKLSPPGKGKVLFVGSSSIRGWDTESAFPSIKSINRGFGGAQTTDVVFYFKRVVLPYEPSVVISYVGGNDIARWGKSVDHVIEDQERLVELIRNNLRETKVVLVSMKPTIRRADFWSEMEKVNEQLKALCLKDPNLFYADISTPMLDTGMPPSEDLFVEDGQHLSEKGYELWASVILPLIENASRQ